MFDAGEFRRSLAAFATGVAVVTTAAGKGRHVGLTINSFASVSLAPPLVLWSLCNTSPNLAVFSRAKYFAINVLTVDQRELSQRFSTLADKFDGMTVGSGYDGIPLIEGCVAQFECIRRRGYDEGDHVIFIGEVVRHWQRIQSHDPLIFCDGAYKSLKEITKENSPRPSLRAK